ncbi:MAG: hypothetical protein JXM71_10165, partial [Spirochaetales bacterium]|nr:hypothetical protein [Spirochaetales bacterium]
LLGKFKSFNESLIQNSLDGSAIVTKEVENGIEEEEKAIESLLCVSGTYEGLSKDVIKAVRAMNIDLDGILESLQFQDITRQMIEGVQAMLSDASSDISILGAAVMGSEAPGSKAPGVEELRALLLSRAHTQGEKIAIKEVRA